MDTDRTKLVSDEEDRTMDQIVDAPTPQVVRNIVERVQQHIMEQVLDVHMLQVVEQIIMRVQHEPIADVSFPQTQEQLVEVAPGIPQEEMTVEHFIDVTLPQVMEDIVEDMTESIVQQIVVPKKSPSECSSSPWSRLR